MANAELLSLCVKKDLASLVIKSFSLKLAPTKFTRNAKITSHDLYLSRHNRRIGPKLKELFTFFALNTEK